MHQANLLKDYTRFNAWANDRMAEWLRPQPAELLTRDIASSFPTLQGTVLHIWGAQDIWLQRLQGESPVSFKGADFSGAPDELWDGLLESSRAFDAFVQQCPDSFFQTTIDYRNLAGKAFSNPVSEIVLHCMQHSTYHRGQLVTMGRGLGLTSPPSTDYIAYTRVRRQD